MMLIARMLPTAGVVLAVLSCSSGSGDPPTGTSNMPPTPPGDPVLAASIDVKDNFYDPSTVQITAGGSVTWNWIGSGHSVTSDGVLHFSPTAPVRNAPYTLAVTFPNAGTYSFHCSVHGVPGTYGNGTMTGAVFVR